MADQWCPLHAAAARLGLRIKTFLTRLTWNPSATHLSNQYFTFCEVRFRALRDTQNPVTLAVTENSPQQVWEVDLRDWLPFEGQARVAASALPEGPLRNSANVVQYVTPYATTRHRVGRGSIRLNWPQPVRGTLQLTARCDTP